jgi:hypothetical protein
MLRYVISNFFFVGVFGYFLFINVQVAVLTLDIFTPSVEIKGVKLLNKKPFRSITLALEPYRGIMMAANYLTKQKIYSVEDSYFPTTDLSNLLISSFDPILTSNDSCLLKNTVSKEQLSSKLTLITELMPLDKAQYHFNRKSYCNGMKLTQGRGFSGVETWGTWSDGDYTEFSLELESKASTGSTLLLTINGLLNPNIPSDKRRIEISVGGKNLGVFEITKSEKFDLALPLSPRAAEEQIKVVIKHLNPMRFADIRGEDIRRISLGFISAKLVPTKSLSVTK